MVAREASALGEHLGLGALEPGGLDDAMARLHARFGASVDRPPGVEVVAFERGAVWKERGGAAWRPVPAPLPRSGSFDDEGYAPLLWKSVHALEEAAKAARGEPTWAHPENLSRAELDARVARMKSHEGPLRVDDKTGLPRNPGGPTGLAGRGDGNLGPILAQDLLVLATDDDGRRYGVLIERRDNGRWAMPGGIVDASDEGARLPTAVREFLEETYGDEPPEELVTTMLGAFADARRLYQGLCPLEARNTDNSWFESTVYVATLPWSVAKRLPLRGSDDAKSAALVELTPDVVENLHADHPRFVAAALAGLAEEG